MGKRILVQRRGRGGSVFRAPTHRRVGEAEYPPLRLKEFTGQVRGVVEELIHDPGRGAPLARVRFEGEEVYYIPAPEGISVGCEVAMGSDAAPNIGNIMPLGSIPEGSIVCNIELKPGDGGKVARSSGTYGTVVAHTPSGTQLKLSSGKMVYIDDRCRAMIGVVAGGGRREKPFLKAGAKAHSTSSRSEKWPKVRGQAMIAASHPFGGGRHRHPGKPTTASRNAPPGRKVGLIAAKQTGRSKRRRR